MAQAIVGTWGKNLAVRIPQEVATSVGLKHGECVEIETMDGIIVIRRPAAEARADAEAAAEEMLRERDSHPLGDVTFRELIDDGRRQ